MLSRDEGSEIDFRLVQPTNTSEPRLLTPSSKIAISKAVQSLKACFETPLTPPGIVIDIRLVQPSKQLAYRRFVEEGITTVFNDVQPLNAFSPMYSIFEFWSTVTDSRAVHPKNNS